MMVRHMVEETYQSLGEKIKRYPEERDMIFKALVRKMVVVAGR